MDEIKETNGHSTPPKALGQETSSGRLTVAKTYKMFINGKFPRTESGRYSTLRDESNTVIANLCRASRKDFREAAVAARGAFPGWAGMSAHLRGQILYRIAEMLEARREQFISELELLGVSEIAAAAEVDASIDRLVYYAGWSDKYQQVFSAVNPVSSSHFNFSLLEPMGVVGVLAPTRSGLLGLVSTIAPIICGGNTCIVLASEELPLPAITFAEVLHASDVPGGVVNLLTGQRVELSEHFASHMDLNALVVNDADAEMAKAIQQAAAENMKRVVLRDVADWSTTSSQSPYLIRDTQETKTTWHPIGG